MTLSRWFQLRELVKCGRTLSEETVDWKQNENLECGLFTFVLKKMVRKCTKIKMHLQCDCFNLLVEFLFSLSLPLRYNFLVDLYIFQYWLLRVVDGWFGLKSLKSCMSTFYLLRTHLIFPDIFFTIIFFFNHC